MKSKNIRTRYFDWLYDRVLHVRDTSDPDSYTVVCDYMHSIPFNDSVPNDSNRAKDAEELIDEFISTFKGIKMEDYVELRELSPPTLFEVLVALTERADHWAGIGRDAWFMKFLENLGLLRYGDANYTPANGVKIRTILQVLNDRDYSYSGEGGLFPLEFPERDQRSSELWFQMAAYIQERGLR